MTSARDSSIPVMPPWSMAVGAMFSVELGSALSLPLVEKVGAAGTAWLRLTAGALIFLALSRPRWREIVGRKAVGLIALGVTTGVMTVSFLAAIARIPLGTSVAIGFLGPLTVAALRSRSAGVLVWPATALIGVVLLTQPWRGDINLAGVGFAVASAAGWGLYIPLTQNIGDHFAGTAALSITMPIAAATAAVAGVSQARGQLTIGIVIAAAGLAILLPVLPYALELAALRYMAPTAFGTLMALEPAIGETLGLVVLHQIPSVLQLVGILLVVVAGAAAQRYAAR